MVMPRSGACGTCSRVVSWIVRVICGGFWGWKMEYWVLDGLGTKLLSWKYWMRLVSSDWASSWRAAGVVEEIMRVVSSAYVYTVERGTVLMMSLIYRRKKVVERVLPKLWDAVGYGLDV